MQWTSIPEGYKHWAGDPAEDNIGPFFFKSMAPKSETALCLQEKHCNMFGIVHGGVLMAFVDYTLCLAGLESTEDGCVTVTCDNQFIGSANAGELLTGHGELIHRTRKLAFVRATLTVEDRTVLCATATLKMLAK
ncbi:PaaI family thioesterase [Zhongshania aquimaris]|uniref:PaaI family thioesterase n=1 Tax=Zhongshania aquimaris TaxID=2857107 RepID=A0ABS6VR94_9GAMM|nr:PaaI family thioesterase [Zhongshania aquimaris]MBW2940559.1 PaaI family thioesterase [Zhongshania aquimaris]